MASLLPTLFASKERYLANHITEINRGKSFPVKNSVGYRDLMPEENQRSVLVSGGTDQERSIFLLSLIKGFGQPTVILHNGNGYFQRETVRNYGLHCENWDQNIYKGMSRNEMLSILAGDEKDTDLVFFFAYAMEVCEVLGRPVTVESISSIDWLGIGWQQELLAVTEQRDRAVDLLGRYDRSMAEKAVKGLCRTERLTRSMGSQGQGLDALLTGRTVLVKEVHGSYSQMARQCLEALQAFAERGRKFTLVLDDVYLPDLPIVKDNCRNVRLIVSGDDITQYGEQLQITNRNSSIVAFRHARYGSAQKLSESFFGEYDKLLSDVNCGRNKGFLTAATQNQSITVRPGRDLRLKPEQLMALPTGCAFVHLVNGVEGMLHVS